MKLKNEENKKKEKKIQKDIEIKKTKTDNVEQLVLKNENVEQPVLNNENVKKLVSTLTNCKKSSNRKSYRNNKIKHKKDLITTDETINGEATTKDSLLKNKNKPTVIKNDKENIKLELKKSNNKTISKPTVQEENRSKPTVQEVNRSNAVVVKNIGVKKLNEKKIPKPLVKNENERPKTNPMKKEVEKKMQKSNEKPGVKEEIQHLEAQKENEKISVEDGNVKLEVKKPNERINKKKMVDQDGFLNRKKTKSGKFLVKRDTNINFDKIVKGINFEEYEVSELEKDLILKGTFRDKVDAMSLVILKNPKSSNELLQLLLSTCEDQRNDNIFYILKSITELLTNNIEVNSTIKEKMIQVLSKNLKNEFLKQKVVILVSRLIAKDIFFDELSLIFINKLGDKKEISKIVESKLKMIYQKNEKVIFKELEKIYFSTEEVRLKKNILNFLKQYKLLGFFLKVFKTEDDLILLGFVLPQISRLIKNEEIDFIKVKKMIDTEKLRSYAFEIIGKRFNSQFDQVIIDFLGGFSNFESVNLINLIYNFSDLKNDAMVQSLVNKCLIMDRKFIMAVFFMLKTRNVDPERCYSHSILLRHFDSTTSFVISNLKDIELFDPFNSEELNRFEQMMVTNIQKIAV